MTWWSQLFAIVGGFATVVTTVILLFQANRDGSLEDMHQFSMRALQSFQVPADDQLPTDRGQVWPSGTGSSGPVYNPVAGTGSSGPVYNPDATSRGNTNLGRPRVSAGGNNLGRPQVSAAGNTNAGYDGRPH